MGVIFYTLMERNGDHLAPSNPLSYPMVKTASLYDHFCKTGNYVIYDVIIWVQDGNCKKWLQRILVLVRSTSNNITKNQDTPIKTVGRDSFLSPKTTKNTRFQGSPSPRGRTAPIF